MKEKLSYFFLICALLCFGFSLRAAGTENSGLSPAEIIKATNQVRIEAGLLPLASNYRLTSAAAAKTLDMESLRYFGHVSPSGQTPWDWIKKNDYNYLYAGENLAINYSDPNKLLQAWLESPSHRKNLLDPNYRDIGVSVESRQINGHRYVFIVQMFGTQKNLAYDR
jgi:uncharacterized protein YkwD